jgi:CRISPR/Cas system-associated exonuclease Cas4 (RecB family)
MAYSTKQKLFAEFMLKRIGFTQADHIEQYLTQLEVQFRQWDGLGEDESIKYSVSNCIQMLIDEIEIKKNKQKIHSKEQNTTILSATDLANYTFCPVSYSIRQSFLIENPTGQESITNGVTLHEQLRLLNKKLPFSLNETQVHRSNVFQDEVIRKIRKSEIAFIGHSEDAQYFKNDEAQFIGQPDYIFKDEHGKYFIVEEKFHSLKPEDHQHWQERPNEYHKITNHFFDNHKIQAISYIRNIKEYKIEYGYLIYWYYQTSTWEHGNIHFASTPRIHDVRIKKILLDENTEGLYKTTVSNIRDLQKRQTQTFDSSKISISKCVGCAVSKYCSHKTRRQKEFLLPYNKDNIELFYVSFPDELKRNT